MEILLGASYKCAAYPHAVLFVTFSDACSTVLAMYKGPMVHMSGAEAFFTAVAHFFFMFFMSAAIGVAFGLLSAVISFQCSSVSTFNVVSL